VARIKCGVLVLHQALGEFQAGLGDAGYDALRCPGGHRRLTDDLRRLGGTLFGPGVRAEDDGIPGLQGQ
jgi:hypothetical protein